MFSVIFMGTPDFAVPALRSLIDSPDYEVLLAVCQPDKPQGRKMTLTPPPVKTLAAERGVEVYQPASMRTDEAYEKLSSLSPDFIVVAAYGKILPERVLGVPKYGCVNLHGSLLPKYRGAAPIQWSVINGDKVTGVTTMLMDAGLDTGDILLTAEKSIGENETAGEVFDALAGMCPALLDRTLKGLADGSVTPVKQNEAEATKVGMLDKEMSVIDWTRSAQSLHDFVRGLNPWPVARTVFCGKALKLYSTLVADRTLSGVPGRASAEKGRLFVKCGEGALEITELQLEGAKRMPADAFIRGHADVDGAVFG